MVYHWQAIHRGAFYRGGPIKTAISSGIDQALWDIKGKVYGVPVYKLLGGPTRDRIRVYGRVSQETGVNAMKTGPSGGGRGAIKYVEGQKYVDAVVDNFKALRQRYGEGVDIAIDFHGAVSRPRRCCSSRPWSRISRCSMKSWCSASTWTSWPRLARKTHIPLATGERIFTKWGFREILEKRAATITPARRMLCRRHHRGPADCGHGRGLLRAAGPAQSARPCSLAASYQIAASIPNFLIQEKAITI